MENLSYQENIEENHIRSDASSKKDSKYYLWSEIENNTQNKLTKNYNISNNKFLFDFPKPESILDSKFYLIRKIGQGSSAKVYLGISIESLNNNNNPKYYSIKIMDTLKTDLNIFKTEIKLLERINHENILKIFAYGFGKKQSLNKNKSPKEVYYIVMEYLEHDELLKYITNICPGENIGFGEDFGRLIFSQLLDGLEAMHNLNIFHRDIKPNNIMVGGDDYKFKFVDFGFGTEEVGRLTSFLGTPNYAAPELHLRKPYFGKSEDIFSLGVTLFVLVTGYLPFKSATLNDSLYQYFIKSDYVGFWTKRMLNLSPSFMELFDNMVAFDYSQRPSISEIRESVWMKEINRDLIPYLKQDLILREEKIKLNEQKNKELIEQETTNKNARPNFSLLETKRQIRNAGTINDTINHNSNIQKNCSNYINEKNNIKKTKKQNIGIAKIKIKRKKNLNRIFNKIRIFFKKKGYVPVNHSPEKYELEITDGEIDLLLKIENLQLGYIKLKYLKIRGSFKRFKLFKKEMQLLKAKFC